MDSSFFLVLSPHSDKHAEILSTSTESGSVIVDVVRQTKPSEAVGGGAYQDTGLEGKLSNDWFLSEPVPSVQIVGKGANCGKREKKRGETGEKGRGNSRAVRPFFPRFISLAVVRGVVLFFASFPTI